mgnify:CR=1 FL=1
MYEKRSEITKKNDIYCIKKWNDRLHKHKNAEVRVYGINKILTNILVIVKSEGVLVKSEGYFWNILWKKKNGDTMTSK